MHLKIENYAQRKQSASRPKRNANPAQPAQTHHFPILITSRHESWKLIKIVHVQTAQARQSTQAPVYYMAIAVLSTSPKCCINGARSIALLASFDVFFVERGSSRPSPMPLSSNSGMSAGSFGAAAEPKLVPKLGWGCSNFGASFGSGVLRGRLAVCSSSLSSVSNSSDRRLPLPLLLFVGLEPPVATPLSVSWLSHESDLLRSSDLLDSSLSPATGATLFRRLCSMLSSALLPTAPFCSEPESAGDD